MRCLRIYVAFACVVNVCIVCDMCAYGGGRGLRIYTCSEAGDDGGADIWFSAGDDWLASDFALADEWRALQSRLFGALDEKGDHSERPHLQLDPFTSLSLVVTPLASLVGHVSPRTSHAMNLGSLSQE